MPVKVIITPSGGQEFELTGNISCDYGGSRNPAPDGSVGQAGYHIEQIRITRERTFTGDDGQAGSNDQLDSLVSGTAEEAYCSGEIQITHPNNLNSPVEKISWKRGHFSQFGTSFNRDSIVDHYAISVISLTQNNVTFERQPQ